jgi:plasmid stability protein
MAATFSIKNVPEEIAERLRERAKRNHRSLQGELLAILEDAVGRRGLTVEEVYQRVKALGSRAEGDSTEIIRQLRDER